MIFIKGMKMPRECTECRFFEKSDEYCYARGAHGSEWGKSTGCPLVEIPPHGDLIDRDVVKKFPIRRDHYDRKNGNPHFINGIETVMEYIDRIPTIIEAEVME